MGKPYSCGYTDDGIGHNCCEIVDEIKKRIKEPEPENLKNYERSNYYLIKKELQKLVDGKKNESR